MSQYLALTTLLAAATQVAAHGHVTNIVVNGVSYEGWDINSFPYMTDPPKVAAWGTPNTANGYIAPDQYSSSDIICHVNATNAAAHVVVAAGDSINLQWTAWPDSHHGPVIDYLARCDGACETVDKTTLEFFKIDGVGLIDDSPVPGTWGDDQLIANNNSWMVQIPESVAPGNYVLRHEIVALHSAYSEGGAQNYPQCFNLQITGSGTDEPTGVLGTELYSETEAGIVVNIYSTLDTYTVPGPTLYSGAASITQATSAITSTGTAVTGTAATTSAASAASTTSSATTPTSTAATTAVTTATTTAASTTTSAASSITTSQPPSSASSAASSTLTSAISSTSTTTFVTRTRTRTKTTTAAPSATSTSGTAQALYQQCGGQLWTGSTSCVEGSTCHFYNDFYSQCISA